MPYGDRPIKGPFSLVASRGDTVKVNKTVLVVVHHLTAATRLMDIVPLVESDHRVQLVYTVPPSSVFASGAHDFLRKAEGLVMPWSQATETRFDLAMAAGEGMLEQLHAPIMSFFHGAGPNFYANKRIRNGSSLPPVISGLSARGLTSRGRALPSAIMVPHENNLRVLAEQCPEAASVGELAGDICFDRMLASRPRRTAYRNALGVGPGQRLIVITSHYGGDSLLQQDPTLPVRLAAELPEDYRVVVFLHPSTWVWHGRRQVNAWMDRDAGSRLTLLPPEDGWRGALVAADLVVGDLGSPVCYASALGLPVVLMPYEADDVVPGSHFELLGRLAGRLDREQPFGGQIEAAMRGWSAAEATELRAMFTSVPGEAARRIRQTIYRLLDLPEPAAEPRAEPVPMPVPLSPPPLATR
ncbi:hypothetical protein [Sinosporangium siamense]|uniref:Uncharacterized protein n=1 Tax=Sinosporangium siamense TaxID=1367973 RepID=A0A919VAJ8_9ACTN|nr:hypothetical protein [Sinosporangium siamense]GII95492.1 hypothetical protein Ssi02_57230 [Sinosporangium siamense]